MSVLAQGVFRENVPFTASSAQSSQLEAGVYRIVSSEGCYFVIGSNPVAADAGANLGSRLPADVVDHVHIAARLSRIAVVRETTDGFLNITQVE